MKKIFFLFALALSSALLPAQQGQGPVYVNGLVVGSFICEFAVNGTRQDMIAEIAPFIENGRVYFLCAALPISSGDLRTNFEFSLDLSAEYFNNPRIKAVYRGAQRGPFDTSHGASVAGYAELGTIIITHVFFEYDEVEKWAKTVRLAIR